MYLTDLVFILDRDFNQFDVIQHNLSNAGKKCRLVVYNNGCASPDEELLGMASVYLSNTSPIEKTYAECVNELIPHLSGQFVGFFHHIAYYSDGWIDLLVDAHIKNFNSGSVSVPTDPDQLWTFILSDDELTGVYEPPVKNSGMFITSLEIVKSVGLFDLRLQDVCSFWHYQERIKLLGYSNYSIPETYCIEMDHFRSSYSTPSLVWKRHLKKTIAQNEIFIPIRIKQKEDEHLIDNLSNLLGKSVSFSERLGAIVLITNELNADQLGIVQSVCKNFNRSFQIIPSSYFDELVLKNTLLILIK